MGSAQPLASEISLRKFPRHCQSADFSQGCGRWRIIRTGDNGLGLRPLWPSKKGDSFELQLIDCTDAEQGGAEHVRFTAPIEPSRIYAAGLLPNMECDIWLRAEVRSGGICRFYYSTDGKKFKDTGVSFTARVEQMDWSKNWFLQHYSGRSTRPRLDGYYRF